MIALHVTSPAPRDVWADLVAGNRSTLPSQTPTWQDAICDLGAYQDASRLYETRDGRTMVLPMVRRTHLPARLATEFSMAPTWGTGGLLTSGGIGVDEVGAVFADLASRPVLRTTIRPDFEQSPLWAATAPSGTIELPVTHHVLDLDRPFDELWTGFSKMARKAIRRAEKVGVTVDSDTSAAYIRDFYGLYEGWVARRATERGLPLSIAMRRGRANEPLARLLMLHEEFGSTFRIWVARLDGQPIASMITLIQGDVALAWRGASNKELAGPSRANDLIHRHAIEFACSQGCRYYNMGESGGVESLMRFKTRFGATPREFAGYRLERFPITAVTSRADALKRSAEDLVIGTVGRVRSRGGSAAASSEDAADADSTTPVGGAPTGP